VVSLDRDHLFGGLEKKYTQEEFEQLCFDYGVELDDVLEEDGRTVYKIDIPANRYDLLCYEGIVRALRVFLGKDPVPEYTVDNSAAGGGLQEMRVTDAVAGVRPVVVCAVLRNLSFDERSYQSFIDLQDKLHHNICRRRTLVSIGTHDLDAVKGPFVYDARAPEDIRFVPLSKENEVNARELFDNIRSNDIHLKPYLHIIENEPKYPVITDSSGTVLSLPPIINGNISRITLNTKNVFIEVTAMDQTKAHIVLNTVAIMFSQYCKNPLSVEEVKIVAADGSSSTSPVLESRECVTNLSAINKLLGLQLSLAEVQKLLMRMGLKSHGDEEKEEVVVAVPPTRSDILHPCDVIEDVAIAYGFNELPVQPPPTISLGKQNPLMQLTDKLRLESALAGFTEALSLSLCSREENFGFLNREDNNSGVTIANPKTQEFQMGRTSLYPGLLKTIGSNQKHKLPLKLFEVSDVILKDPSAEAGARNRRRLAAVYCDRVSGFEVIHGFVDRIMRVLDVLPAGTPRKDKPVYHLEPRDDPTYFKGRAANLIVAFDGKPVVVGHFGVVHPLVIKNFKLSNVCSAVELDVEYFL